MKLKNRVAIITGGTGALGKAAVSAFLEEGAKVICTYVIDEELKSSSSLMQKYESDLVFVRADVTIEKQVAETAHQALQGFGRIDILVTIVGGFTYAKTADTDEQTWDRMMSMNLKSTFLCAKAVLPQMIKQNYGKIINISTRPALKGSAGIGAYSASKAGVLNLTETIADEVQDYDINVNAILPSTIDTPANRKSMPDSDFSTWVKPGEIARVIVFLASDDSKPISGAGIPVYGKA